MARSTRLVGPVLRKRRPRAKRLNSQLSTLNYFRRRFLEQELLEVSAVAIPANPDALALGLKSGAVSKGDVQATLDPSLRAPWSGRSAGGHSTLNPQLSTGSIWHASFGASCGRHERIQTLAGPRAAGQQIGKVGNE